MGRQSSAKAAGAKRLYYCHPCGARHSPPTGLRCERQRGKTAEAEATTSGTTGGSSRTSRAERREIRSERSERAEAQSNESSDSETVTISRNSKAIPSGKTQDKGVTESATEGMLTSIMEQMRSMADEQKRARDVDRAEMRAAISDLTRKIEAPILSDADNTSGSETREPDVGINSFAAPCRRKRTGKSETADPLSKLKGDKTSQAQAQLLLSSKGARVTSDEDGEIRSGYYHTLADTMILQEFIQGYLHIIASSLPINNSTRAAFDHIAYLCDNLTDSMHTDWDLVLNSHRQVLHMIEQGQLVWEHTEARNSQREKQLARADKARSSGRSLPGGGQRAGGNRNSGYQQRVLTCVPYQTGKCEQTSSHRTNGQWLQHFCATCVRVTGQKNPHRDIDCKRKALHDARSGSNSQSSA